MPASFGALSFG
jgi:uncharacterized membrane protein